MKNEMLTVNAVNALANKELKKNLGTMLKALESGNKAVWTYANGVYRIIKGEQFKEDFETQGKFASYVGLSKGAISQYINAVDFMNNHAWNVAPYCYTVGKAYLLSTLTDEELASFTDYCSQADIDTHAISDKCLKDTMAAWQESLATPVDAEDSKEAVADEADTAGSVENVEFELNGKKYSIPAKILAKYEVQ